MNGRRQFIFWATAALVLVFLIWGLRSILLPFAAGLAAAYFLDPLVDRVERVGVGRTIATSIVTALFFLAIIAVFALLAPILQTQVLQLVDSLPDYIQRLRELVTPIWQRVMDAFPAAGEQSNRETLAAVTENAAGLIGKVLNGILGSGIALFNILSLFFITPVVAFYLLRDWDGIIHRVHSWLPREHAPVIREQASKIDDALAGFLRGQAMVCMIQALLYSIGLSAIGLKFGLIVGILTGMVTFIPYVGNLIGIVTSTILTLLQFGFDPVQLGLVWGLFLVIQTFESLYLTPKLVGERVGLHPVWVIFALMAGGALLGFLGVLIAVPVAAAIGVLVRFALERYLDSRMFHGRPVIPREPPADLGPLP